MDVPTHPRRSSSGPHLIWFMLVSAPVAYVLIGAAQTEQPEGQCTGIGWGCTLSGGDLAGLMAMVLLPPALVVLLVGHLLISAVQRSQWSQDRRNDVQRRAMEAVAPWTRPSGE